MGNVRDAVDITICTEAGRKKISTERGETILKAAHEAGVEIMATCGARGRCRSCRCKIIEGTLPPPSVADTVQLGHEEVRERFRLACQTRILDTTVVEPMPIMVQGGAIKLLYAIGSASGRSLRLLEYNWPASPRQQDTVETLHDRLAAEVSDGR